MFRCLLWAFAAAVRPRLLLIADNLCLRQQLLVLQRRKPQPRLTDADRRFWILAYRWLFSWRTSLQNDSQVYASKPSSQAVFPLAVISEAACVGRLGVRLLLRPDHNV
jgi:hypothetical protein